MTDLKTWTKTMLTVFNYLDRICGAIDKLEMTQALGSFYADSLHFSNNTMQMSEKMMALTEKKVTLINLKILVHDVLLSMDKNDAILLILKHLRYKKMEEIANLMHCSPRSVFRKVSEAYDAFEKNLAEKNYSGEKLKKMLQDESWILEVFNKYSKENTKNVYVFETVQVDPLSVSRYFKNICKNG